MPITSARGKSQFLNTMGVVWEAILDFVYPAHCLLCALPLATPTGGICDGCRSSLNVIDGPGCLRCGCPTDPRQSGCRNCADKQFRFSRMRTLASFNPQMQRMIHLLKYRGKCRVGRVLGDALGKAVSEDSVLGTAEMLVPVPLHSSRERERGFNQSAIIARAIDAHLRIGVREDVLKRVRPTETQTTLDIAQREGNVSNAFQVRKASRVENRPILLVDDVVTTGSTANACTNALLAAGASEVFVVAAACPYLDEGDTDASSNNRT